MNHIIKELRSHGDLFNESTLESILKPLTSHEGLSDRFFKEHRAFYYTGKSRSIRDYSFLSSDEAVFKIVKFPNTRNFFNHPWSFGFVRQMEAGVEVWRGAYAGRHGELFSKLKKVINTEDSKLSSMTKVDFPRAITRVDVFKEKDITSFAKSLYQELDDKREWGVLGGINGLKTYLINLTHVARSKSIFREATPKEYYLKKENSGYILLFNSGLLDKYSNFIMLRADLIKCNNSFLSEPYYAVGNLSKVETLSDYGLSEALPLIQFCKKSELVFPAEGITLGDRQGVGHIFRDRANRLGSELQTYSTELLYTLLEHSVKLAMKRSKVDIQHLVPFLNMKWDKISYLMPFYASHLNKEEPLCAIVIGEVRTGVWAPITILRLETARSNARLLGKVNASWLISKGDVAVENSTSEW